MKTFLHCILLLATLTLSGCASLFGSPPAPGASEQEVIAQMGSPTNRYRAGDQTLLEYSGGYYGQRTWMAHIGPDGRLIRVEQVRTVEKFGQIKINQSTKQDVLSTVGTPSETSWLSRRDMEVWSYRYKENEVWNSMMHVFIDRTGVVRGLENGRDPLYDTSERRR